jgi:TetR/AcrR family transcriptional regulator, repressor for uid operon
MSINPSDSPPARLPLAERRRRILETAVQVYAQHGFHQTGMRQLCAALGMSAGALYRYFPGKESIIAGLVEMDREMIQHNLRSLPPDVSFIGTMQHMLEVTMGELQTNEGLLAIWSEISSEATRNPAVAALLSNHYQFIENLISSLVQAALKRGELRDGVDPLATARFIMASHDGMMTRRAIDPTYPLQQVARESLGLLACAVGATPPVASKKSARKKP